MRPQALPPSAHRRGCGSAHVVERRQGLALSALALQRGSGPSQALCPRLAPLGEELVATSPRVQDGCDCLPGVTRG